MTPETERLYRIWQQAVESSCVTPRGGVTTPCREAMHDAKINRARLRYEAALRAERDV